MKSALCLLRTRASHCVLCVSQVTTDSTCRAVIREPRGARGLLFCHVSLDTWSFALFWTRVVHLIKIHGHGPPYKLFAPSALSVYLLLCLGQTPQKKSRSRLAFGRGHGGHCSAAIVLRPLFCGLAPLPGFWVEPRKAPLGAPVRWLGPKPAPLCLSPHCRVGFYTRSAVKA